MFGDDTKIFCEIKVDHDGDQLQNDLKALEKRPNNWLLRINAEKRTTMKDGHPVELQTTSMEKELGTSLIFSAHCEQQVNKANRLHGFIRRSYTYLDGESLDKRFATLVRPYLEYAKAVLYPVYREDSILFENVQRRMQTDCSN